MGNASEFQPRKEKIISISSDSTLKHDIMKPKIQEERYMANDTYTKTEIDGKFNKLETKIENLYTKNEIDLKFENLEQKISSGFENMGLRMEKMFSDFKLEQQNEKEENKKWLIALTVGSLLSIFGIAVSIIAILVQK